MTTEKNRAIRLCRDLWKWLAETGQQKADWPGWKSNGGRHKKINSLCFACKYSEDISQTTCIDGENCFLIELWPEGCMTGDTPYQLWDTTSDQNERKRYAQIIADYCTKLLKIK